MAADQLAGWPQETAVGLFDIISVSLQSKQRLRLPIRQVCLEVLHVGNTTCYMHVFSSKVRVRAGCRPMPISTCMSVPITTCMSVHVSVCATCRCWTSC